jgi:transcriptional regulator with XRE-family HTH domain
MVKIYMCSFGGDSVLTKIMELRIKRGLTREEITAALRLSAREYELIELGLKEVPKELEKKLYSYLEITGA